MLRCNAERDRTLADPECINARKAVARISARDEDEKKARLEAQSERKRDQLRRQREARDRILADRRERNQVETAAKEMAEFTGTTNLPPTAVPGDANTGGLAQTPADPGAQLPAGVSPATVAQPTAVAADPVVVVTDPIAKAGADNAVSISEKTLRSGQPPAATDPVSVTATSATSDDDIEAEIQRLEAELRKRREAEISRLEQELRLRKQQNDALTNEPGATGSTSD